MVGKVNWQNFPMRQAVPNQVQAYALFITTLATAALTGNLEGVTHQHTASVLETVGWRGTLQIRPVHQGKKPF
jgi:hypothetical protein